ncbi:glycosyl hydrolase family 28-related protein [Paenibacillus silvisoli]|uniref:glycosyl hydrolase family 28-related protein n=1 Tax=Paenibacillus silvisoli TaxID=3110539 RepID=UPI002804DFBD|nr:glycosyl hydrolase family 28-related protein [Paenibacillus silvisoli]
MTQASQDIAKQYSQAIMVNKIWGGIVVNVKAFGAEGDGETDDTAAIQKAIDYASENGGTVVFPSGTYAVGSITIPANIMLQFQAGAKLSIATGQTVTINGGIDAGLQQIFSGLGTVAGSMQVDRVYPQWWGAKGDGVTDDTAAIQAAINAASTALNATAIDYGAALSVIGTGKTYSVSATLTLPRNITLDNFNFVPTSAVTTLISLGDGVTRQDKAGLSNIWIDARVANAALIGVRGRFTAYNNFTNLKFSGIKLSTQIGFLFEGLEHTVFTSIHVYGAGTGLSLQNGPAHVNDVTFNAGYIADCGVTAVDLGDFVDSAVFNQPYFEACAEGIRTFSSTAVFINPIFDTMASVNWVNYTYSGGSKLVFVTSQYAPSDFRFNDVNRASNTQIIGYNQVGALKHSMPANRKNVFVTYGYDPDLVENRIQIYPNDFTGSTDGFTTNHGMTIVYRSTNFGAVRFCTQDGVERVKVFNDGRIQLNQGGYILSGSGSPEGNKTAPVGSLYMRTDGGAGNSFYVKESGTGATGWVNK